MAATFGDRPDTDDDTLRYETMGFRVQDISVPGDAWYADQDPLVHAGEELCRQRPGTELTVYPGEGHFVKPTYRSDWLAKLTDW